MPTGNNLFTIILMVKSGSSGVLVALSHLKFKQTLPDQLSSAFELIDFIGILEF